MASDAGTLCRPVYEIFHPFLSTLPTLTSIFKKEDLQVVIVEKLVCSGACSRCALKFRDEVMGSNSCVFGSYLEEDCSHRDFHWEPLCGR